MQGRFQQMSEAIIEDETVNEMEQMAESIGMTLEDAYEYAEEYRNREEEASYGYGY